jgi:FdhD protein
VQQGDCQRIRIKKFVDGEVFEEDDTVVVEHELTIHVDGREFITLLCTPRSLDELTVGFLYAEGLIDRAADIGDLAFDVDLRNVRVTLRDEAALERGNDWSGRPRTVTSAGGQGGKTLMRGANGVAAPVPCRALPLDGRLVWTMMESFSRKSTLFRDTGGVHSCALSDGRAMLVFEDDIGRHNALDKIIGHTLLEDIPVDDKIILTSGRVSSEIVGKVAKCGIGAIVSRSAPTSFAIESAQALGMTLVGFARGKKFNIYANFSCLEGAR